jgi:hypothetical protein
MQAALQIAEQPVGGLEFAEDFPERFGRVGDIHEIDVARQNQSLRHVPSRQSHYGALGKSVPPDSGMVQGVRRPAWIFCFGFHATPQFGSFEPSPQRRGRSNECRP